MSKTVELTRRMQAAADMVSSGNRVCDVGCDHGYVSIYLVQTGRSPHVLAMDVNKGPLLRAKEHVEKYHVEDYITLRLSDGLTAYRKGEAQSLICAGMGGRLMMNILEKDLSKTFDFQELILQPQSEIPLFRKFLREKGYIFIKEDMILEEGKFYPIMKAARSESAAAENKQDEIGAGEDKKRDCKEGETDEEFCLLQDMLGPLLLKERHPVLLQFIQKEIRLKQEILDKLEGQEALEKHGGLAAGGRSLKRQEELQSELALFRKAETLWKS